MPTDFDTFSLYVVVTSDSGLNIERSGMRVDSDVDAEFAFMYKPGKPPADRFSVAWFADASRTQAASSAPSNPRFTPATPDPASSGIADLIRFYPATLRVRAPTLPRVSQRPAPPNDVRSYYGRITLHQA